MDIQTPCGMLANHRTAPIPYCELSPPEVISILRDRYPTASIYPHPMIEGDDTYRIYWYLERSTSLDDEEDK